MEKVVLFEGVLSHSGTKQCCFEFSLTACGVVADVYWFENGEKVTLATNRKVTDIHGNAAQVPNSVMMDLLQGKKTSACVHRFSTICRNRVVHSMASDLRPQKFRRMRS